MSDNEFWLGFWTLVLVGLMSGLVGLWTGVKLQKEHEKSMYEKCISSDMQYVNGNCLYGKGRQ